MGFRRKSFGLSRGHFVVRAAVVLLVSGCMIRGLQAGPRVKGAAQFVPGKEVALLERRVGPAGGVLKTGASGAPVDNITIEIPPGALPREVVIKISYNKGKLTLPNGSGASSEAFLRLSAEGVKEFAQPIMIKLRYDPRRHASAVVIGYSIDDQGRLRVLNQGNQDVKAGTASFSTVVPILFTWVYG